MWEVRVLLTDAEVSLVEKKANEMEVPGTGIGELHPIPRSTNDFIINHRPRLIVQIFANWCQHLEAVFVGNLIQRKEVDFDVGKLAVWVVQVEVKIVVGGCTE